MTGSPREAEQVSPPPITPDSFYPEFLPPALDPNVTCDLLDLGKSAGESFFGQLADLFVADASVRIVAMSDALGRDDPEAVVCLAHALGGASGMLGATELVRLCAILEGDGGSADERAAVVVEALGVELSRVRLALDAAISATARDLPGAGVVDRHVQRI